MLLVRMKTVPVISGKLLFVLKILPCPFCLNTQ